MDKNYINIKIFKDKEFTNNNILLLGYNKFIVDLLPKGSTTIDPSIPTISNASKKHPDHHFYSENLSNFSMDKKYSSILSINSLHKIDNIKDTFKSIYKHLDDEAIIYFPLAPNSLIEAFLNKEEWLAFKRNSPIYQKRTRAEVEDAVLSANFKNFTINEELKNISFSSDISLCIHLKSEIEMLTNLKDKELDKCTNELFSFIHKEKDTIISLSYQYILVTLDNHEAVF